MCLSLFGLMCVIAIPMETERICEKSGSGVTDRNMLLKLGGDGTLL